MKKIIVPIDFSEHSEFALEAAASLAQKFDSELIVLHMLELSNAIISSASETLSQEAVFYLKLAEQKFDTFLDKPYLKDIKVTPIVKHFKVWSEVNDIAIEHDANLIVMGSQGASGFKEVLIGSNTQKVVRHANIPVLVIKHNPILLDFENAVFASDFEEEAVKPYLKAKETFDALGTKMHLVYVNSPDGNFRSSSEIDKKIAAFLRIAEGGLDNLKDVNVVSDYSIEKGILNFANVIGADVIAVATHGRKGLSHFFDGSVSEDIANHSTLPVMTFKI
ncbi:nucleotide-binding universal stress UspA family protein [Winogradskyella eximia]|jgi:nucleotide-binding universal stress UspA family protein|uniref:Nucleotide-binding universal stress UspA family protein n=1 Tax=Winogradskyella eximia TaxID=262006 RepID=A0A3D9GZQ8_9FLAO|nr:universal stress protein [Winogradskyella eximia]RED42715.1 nucleotide-binding universal stress UspA family protein [Winogradskyella eximia]|tara:strand:+ start:4642 stop:5475 length:834 start_codon:yes stop_codon:yes gene_type:complete